MTSPSRDMLKAGTADQIGIVRLRNRRLRHLKIEYPHWALSRYKGKPEMCRDDIVSEWSTRNAVWTPGLEKAETTLVDRITDIVFQRAGCPHFGLFMAEGTRETALTVRPEDMKYRQRLWEAETGLTVAELEHIVGLFESDIGAFVANMIDIRDRIRYGRISMSAGWIPVEQTPYRADYKGLFADGDNRRIYPEIPGRMYLVLNTNQAWAWDIQELDEDRDLMFVHYSSYARRYGVAKANQFFTKTDYLSTVHGDFVSRSPAFRWVGGQKREFMSSPTVETATSIHDEFIDVQPWRSKYINDEDAPDVEEQYNTGQRNRDGTKNW